MYTRYRVLPGGRSTRLFEAACAAAALEPTYLKVLGGSDANNFYQKGLICLNVGLEMNNIHSPDEYMRPSQFVKGVRLLERVIGG
jgi:tripeptide aminopeptidase